MSQSVKSNPAAGTPPPTGIPIAKQSPAPGMIVGVINTPVSDKTSVTEARPITGASDTGSGDQNTSPVLAATVTAEAARGGASTLAMVSGATAKPNLVQGGGGDTQPQPQLQPVFASSAATDAPYLANTKEKTPMCLINELARYNKIQHQYTLTDEQGPAHKKTFFVKLKLGEEEYSASGQSIKKAQHAAAEMSLGSSKYKNPPLKTRRHNELDMMVGHLTPTVELNALAMQRGEVAIYRNVDPQRPPYYPPPNLDFRGMYNQRYHYPHMQRLYFISLKVGHREFIGEGQTRQAARHNAASKALKVVSMLPIPNELNVPVTQPSTDNITPVEKEEDEDTLKKSEISMVHEIALRRHLSVNFTVIRESGPPHMRSFVTRCTVGELNTEGEGNGKKASKKKSAQRMLNELKKMSPLPPTVARPKPKNQPLKKKIRNLVKVSDLQVQKTNPDYGSGINPISRLIQIQQAKKEREPVYTLVAERGMTRRREFIMQVTVNDRVCQGIGPNKKLAKRTAAESMLQLLGYSRPALQPTKPALKMTTNGEHSPSDKKVSFVDTESQGTGELDTKGGRQLVPGVLFMHNQQQQPNYMANPMTPIQQTQCNVMSSQTTSQIAKELLDKGSSPTAEALLRTGAKPMVNKQTIGHKQQLRYLADVLNFQVQFTDFPKGTNKSEYLSLVSLSTSPPQVSHGSGGTIDESHDAASHVALKALAEMGLASVKSQSDPTDVKASPPDSLTPVLQEQETSISTDAPAKLKCEE